MLDGTRNHLAQLATRSGQVVSRYGLVVVLAWIGFGKFVKMESRVLIEHSPLMSWIYHVLSVSTVARLLGTMEIVAALLIALRPLWPRVSAAGSALAIVLFLGTISFLFTTPGVIATHAGGVPVLSALPGQFLLKDLVLIGVALWTLGDSLGAARLRRGEEPAQSASSSLRRAIRPHEQGALDQLRGGTQRGVVSRLRQTGRALRQTPRQRTEGLHRSRGIGVGRQHSLFPGVPDDLGDHVTQRL
jgi:uncharacterized membrane protein YkgB